MKWDLLLQLLVNGVIVGMLYGVVAMCFVLVYKSSSVVNFAQGEFLIIGAFVCLWFVQKFDLPFAAAFAFTLVFMFVFGVALQYAALRPLVGEPLISVLMVTVGLALFFQALLKWLFGVDTYALPPVFEQNSVEFLGLQFETAYLLILAVSAATMTAFYWFFTKSRTGLAMRATASDQQVAQSMGISVEKVFALAWGISAAVSALAGVTLGIVNGISTALAFTGIKVFPAVILGGLESIAGGVVGGVVIGVLENLAEFVDGQYLHWGNMLAIAPFYVLIVILMIKPYGFFGAENIERV
ncbi:MAG: branched-chain amino acid ABC transporter permease [Gammaproteobacteria bacterium]